CFPKKFRVIHFSFVILYERLQGKALWQWCHSYLKYYITSISMQQSLLQRYIADQCTAAEQAEVEEWLSRDPQHRDRLESLKRIWEVPPKEEMEVDARAEWMPFRKKVFGTDSKAAAPISSKPATSQERKRSGRGIMYWAAAATVLLAVGLAYLYGPKPVDEQEQPQLAMKQLTTQKGERASYILSDGTHIYLNAATKVVIPSNFGKQSREVYLRYGEAYFQVAHKPGNPFTVYSREAFTKVLGTKFVVRAYPAQSNVQVVVEEGKVALGTNIHPNEPVAILEQNQLGLLLEADHAQVSQVGNIDQYLGWKSGKLIFNNTPFHEVQKRLERWYNVECTFSGTLIPDRPLTATFEG